MEARVSPLSSFRSKTFATFWAASLISNLGTLIQTVGAGWMMTQLTSSRDMVALVQSSATLPIMLFSLVAGALADSIDRRRLMLTAQGLMLSVSILLAALAFAGLLTPWLLLGFTFLLGCGTALYNPSWQASIGDIVPREDVHSAVLLNSVGFNMMRSVGPAIGGAIVAAAGAAMAFAVNAVSYVALIGALAIWRPNLPAPRLPRENLGHAITAGVRYVSMSPTILVVLARGFLFGVSAVVIVALLPLVAREQLQGTALSYGILLGAFGLGAIAGALGNGRVTAHFDNEAIVRVAFLGFAGGCAILSVADALWMGCIALLIAGACWVLALSLFNVSVQLSTPRWVVGRALAFYQAATFGGMTLGSWIWGEVAEAHGLRTALLGAALALAVGAAAGLKLRLPDFSDRDLGPLGSFTEPELRIDIRPRSGPIMVMVDYQVDQSDVPAFLGLMAQRRRIRIRDGARQWALLRDLENPDVWTESYHVPTWVEYVRHNERRTRADAEVTDQLRALHRGAGTPRVHRMIERQTVPLTDDMPLKPLSHHHH